MRFKFDPVFEIGDDGIPERRDVEEKIVSATTYAVPFIFACYISFTVFAAIITGSVEMNFSYFTMFSSIPAANVISWITKISMGIVVLLFLLTKIRFKGGQKSIARNTIAILREVTFAGYMAATVIVDIMLVTGDPSNNWIARFTDGVHIIVIPAWVDLAICGSVAIMSFVQLAATTSLSRVRIGLERAFSDPTMGGKVVVSGTTRFECIDTPIGKMCRIA
jgi:hypothetical protein